MGLYSKHYLPETYRFLLIARRVLIINRRGNRHHLLVIHQINFSIDLPSLPCSDGHQETIPTVGLLLTSSSNEDGKHSVSVVLFFFRLKDEEVGFLPIAVLLSFVLPH